MISILMLVSLFFSGRTTPTSKLALFSIYQGQWVGEVQYSKPCGECAGLLKIQLEVKDSTVKGYFSLREEGFEGGRTSYGIAEGTIIRDSIFLKLSGLKPLSNRYNDGAQVTCTVSGRFVYLPFHKVSPKKRISPKQSILKGNLESGTNRWGSGAITLARDTSFVLLPRY